MRIIGSEFSTHHFFSEVETDEPQLSQPFERMDSCE